MASSKEAQSIRILGWDTSSQTGYFCALQFELDATVSEVKSVLKVSSLLNVEQRQHSEGLLAGVSDALHSLGWMPQDLSAIGVGVGPGSFTGIRIGLTTARTFGQILGIPLLAVSSLEVLERAFLNSSAASDKSLAGLLICQDACMGELYCRYRSFENYHQSFEWVCKARHLNEHLQLRQVGLNEPVGVVLPDAWSSQSILVEIFSQPIWKVHLRSSLVDLPVALSGLILDSWRQGRAKSALAVHPSYLRASDAELHLIARENALRNQGSNG